MIFGLGALLLALFGLTACGGRGHKYSIGSSVAIEPGSMCVEVRDQKHPSRRLAACYNPNNGAYECAIYNPAVSDWRPYPADLGNTSANDECDKIVKLAQQAGAI